MSLNNFIPEIWSTNLIHYLQKAHVYAGVANRQYDRVEGNRVRINQFGAVTVNSYTRNNWSTGLTLQTLDDAQTWLDLDQEKYFAFVIDDADAAQMNVNIMQDAMQEAGYQLMDTADQYIAGLYASAGMSQNSTGSGVAMTSANVEDEFLAAQETMDENNVPREGRFAIIPPWVHTKLILAGIADLTDNVQTFTNGFIGRALGFDFLLSNNVSKNSSSWDDTRIMCGVRGRSWWYADQVKSVEGQRVVTEGFGDLVKGLHVYGGKVRSDMTLTLYADETAEP